MPPLDSTALESSSSHHEPLHAGKQAPTRYDNYLVAKAASDIMEASISAVLDFLAAEGVSRASIDELRHDSGLGRHVEVMERASDYASAVYEQRHVHSNAAIVVYLLLAAWQALARYLAVQYQNAHRHYCCLRRQPTPSKTLQRALDVKVDLAEQCCRSQKGFLLADQWQRQCQSL